MKKKKNLQPWATDLLKKNVNQNEQQQMGAKVLEKSSSGLWRLAAQFDEWERLLFSVWILDASRVPTKRFQSVSAEDLNGGCSKR